MTITSRNYLLIFLFILFLGTLLAVGITLLPHLHDIWRALLSWAPSVADVMNHSH